MKKLLVLLIAALLLTFTLAGCSHADYTGGAGAPDTSNTQDVLSSHTVRVATEAWDDGTDMALVIHEDNYSRHYLAEQEEDFVLTISAAEYSSAMYAYVSSLPLSGVTSAKVRIRFAATEERFGEYAEYIPNELVDISQLAAYQTFIDPGMEEQWESGWRVVYTANAAVHDFQLIGLSYGFLLDEPTTNIYVREIIYALHELSPELPLAASWVHEGCFTTGRGVSFVYDGAARYFEIVHSNKSGHLFLREFVSG